SKGSPHDAPLAPSDVLMGMLELFRRDRYEAYPVARSQQARALGLRVEEAQRRATDQMPAARQVERIYSGELPANCHAPGWHARARGWLARCRDPGVQPGQIGEPRCKAEHLDSIQRCA